MRFSSLIAAGVVVVVVTAMAFVALRGTPDEEASVVDQL
jgi:hypothetical protein